MSESPLVPRIVQPVCFSLKNLNKRSNGTMQVLAMSDESSSTVRVNVLTPSPERLAPDKSDINVISDDSDVEELPAYSLPTYSLPAYSLPPTPSISDDSDDVVLLTCLPTVKSVTSLKEVDTIPDNLRVHPCHWDECYVSCETRESLHKHILSRHTVSGKLFCGWINCLMFGKTFRTDALFERHIQTHTDALIYSCIWEGCAARFKSDALLQRHLVIHIRKKKKVEEEEARKKKGEEISNRKEEEISTRKQKKRRCCYKSVVRQSYETVIEDPQFDKETMNTVKRKVCKLYRCAANYKTIDLSTKKIGYREDEVVGRQWLLQARRDSTLTRWCVKEDAKVSVPLKKCPDSVLVQLGLLAKQARRRKQKKNR